MIRFFLVVMLMLGMRYASRAEYLWWAAEDPDYLPANSSSTVKLGTVGEDLGIEFARVRIDGGAYLDLYLPPSANPMGDTYVEYAVNYDGDSLIFPIYADVTGYYGTDSQYVMIIELGNYTDYSDPNSWVVKAISPQYVLDQKIAGHITEDLTKDPLSGRMMISAFSVPEPTSGMLLMLGFSLMALRRRRAVLS